MNDGDDPVAALREADAALRAAREEVRAVGVDDLEAVAEAYREVEGTLDRYEERATDWDDFEGYVRFREALSERVADLPEDLPHRGAFDDADDALTTAPQRVLSADDFERAREDLAPARDLSALRDRWRAARESYRDARHAVAERRDDLAERVAELERLRDLGNADLDAPVERLRDPVETYDERVAAAFAAFRSGSSARAVLDFVADTAAYPLVPFRQPPERLRAYVADAPPGEEPIPALLEYADYSRSKLDHYVEDPGAFQSAVATNRTYLRRLDATPLTVDWPPPPAARLRWRARELVAVTARFADEEVVALARDLRALAARDDYARLRESAVARVDLDETERERLRSGAVARALREAREERTRLAEALDDRPPLNAFDTLDG